MYSLRTIGAGLLALATTTLAAAVPELIERDSSCVNGPSTRSCWANGFSVATNTDTKWPETGKTVTVGISFSTRKSSMLTVRSTTWKSHRRQCLQMALQGLCKSSTDNIQAQRLLPIGAILFRSQSKTP